MYQECTNKTNSLDGATHVSAEQTVIFRFDCPNVKEVSFIKKLISKHQIPPHCVCLHVP